MTHRAGNAFISANQVSIADGTEAAAEEEADEVTLVLLVMEDGGLVASMSI